MLGTLALHDPICWTYYPVCMLEAEKKWKHISDLKHIFFHQDTPLSAKKKNIPCEWMFLFLIIRGNLNWPIIQFKTDEQTWSIRSQTCTHNLFQASKPLQNKYLLVYLVFTSSARRPSLSPSQPVQRLRLPYAGWSLFQAAWLIVSGPPTVIRSSAAN